MAQAVGLADEPEIYTLEEGTPIKVRTTNTLSTKSATSGETFVASLAEPIFVGDKVIAGDRVTVELSPYDLRRGRITYRFK